MLVAPGLGLVWALGGAANTLLSAGSSRRRKRQRLCPVCGAGLPLLGLQALG